MLFDLICVVVGFAIVAYSILIVADSETEFPSTYKKKKLRKQEERIIEYIDISELSKKQAEETIRIYNSDLRSNFLETENARLTSELEAARIELSKYKGYRG